MCADAGFHADQARREIGEPRFHLATRPLLPQHDGAARVVAHDVERVFANIDADHGDCAVGLLRHGVLLVFGAPRQLLSLTGLEHGRTIPLADPAGRWLAAAAAAATAAAAPATTATETTATATAATTAPATTATATPRHLLQGAAVVFLVEQMKCRQTDVRDLLLAQRDRLCRREVEFLRHVRSRRG